MSERITIEVRQSRGFAGSDYTRSGYFIAAVTGSGYDGGGFDRHTGHWLVLSDVETGELFSEPLHRCREVPTPTKQQETR